MKLLCVLVLLAIATSCSSNGASPPRAVRGPAEPHFDSAADLVSAARHAHFSCVDEHRFNPLENVAPDGIDYAAPDARTCNLPTGEPIYFIVYDTQADRMEAFDHGEVQLNLCKTRPSESWNALVAANWRAATPASARALSGLDTSFSDAPVGETLSCEFRS